MALPLTEAFLREAVKTTPPVSYIVEFVGLSGMNKFACATRRILGYFPLVDSVNPRASSIDPLKCTQTVSAIEISFTDSEDGIIRALVEANKLFGKKVKVYLGFDTGDDATFLESDYAGFSAGVVTNVEVVDGLIRIEAKDARSSIFSKNGSTIKVPRPGVVDGQQVSFSDQGAATLVMKDLLIAAALSATHGYDAASYAIAASPGCGHLTIDRLKSLGRDLTEPTPADDLLSEIAQVLRGYNLLQEDGLIAWKEVDPAGTIAGRFLETDMYPGTAKVRTDFSRIVNSVSIRSAYENLNTGNVLGSSGGFRVELRDDDLTAQADWSFSDGTDQVADLPITDYWFSSIAPTKDHDEIPLGTGDIDIVDINFAGSPIATQAPNVVDASHPGYILARGYRSSTDAVILGPAPIEIIKYTSITSPSAGHLRLSGITRAQLNTSEVVHAKAPGDAGLAIGPVVVDVTALVRCADLILKRFKEGAAVIEFKTPLNMYKYQLADLVYLELESFLRYGKDGLAAGNTTVFEIIRKDTDPEKGEITWTLIEVRTGAHTGRVRGSGNWGPSHGSDTDIDGGMYRLGGGFLGPQASGSGSLAHAFIDATLPVVSIDLSTTVPTNRALTRSGWVTIGAEAKTFTASKDTYVDLVPYPGGKSHWRYTEVANGAAAPSLAAGELRAFVVVTSGTAITGVTSQAATQLVDGPNLKTGDVGGIGALANVDASGRLVDPVIKDGTGSVHRKLKNIGGKFLTTDAAGAEKATVFSSALTSEKPFFAGKAWADEMAYAATVDRAGKNWCQNPSFEDAAAGTSFWEGFASDASGTVPTLSRDTTQHVFGLSALKVANGDAVWTGFIGARMTKASSPVALEGEFWCASAWVRVNNRVGVTIEITFYTSADAFVGSTGYSLDVPANTWLPISVIADAAGAVGVGGYGRVSVKVATPNTIFDLFVDGVTFEKSPKPSSFFDGNMGEGYGWDGAVNLSTSTRTGGLNNHGALAADSEPVIFYDDGEVSHGQFTPSVGSAAKIGLPGNAMRIAGAGTVFPPTPTLYDVFFRTDRGILYYYDGTRWLSVHVETMDLIPWSAFQTTTYSASATDLHNNPVPAAAGGTQVLITQWSTNFFVGATNDASNDWTVKLTNSASAVIGSYRTGNPDLPAGWNNTVVAVESVRTLATDKYWSVQIMKNGSPSVAQIMGGSVHYRLIG